MQAPTIKLGPYAVEEALTTIHSIVRAAASLTTRAKPDVAGGRGR